ncbi:MAG: hypothetical protein QM699_03845 [Amaricoccus sp.]|uniref:SMP-30/gluconolactonase/LRE family protein n=1 Tax=Amaricoccus sp. TaxID=1872485 RepID=UPI0039E6210A
MRATFLAPTVLASLLLATVSLPAAAGSPAPRTIPGFEAPESVLIAGERRFVSNIGVALDPTARDGDGFISELAPDGHVVAARAFPRDGSTLDAPKGMAMAGGRLYVADIDRVVGFDASTGGRVFEARLPTTGPTLANDLAAVDDGHLLVSDTLGGSVWSLDLATGSFTRLTGAVPGANGILYDPRTRSALVVGLGADFGGGDIFRVGLDGSTERVQASPHGIFDGIARLPDGAVVVSDWIALAPPTPGRFLRHAPDGSGPGAPFDPGVAITGPADFSVDADGAVWSPATPENAVVIATPPDQR